MRSKLANVFSAPTADHCHTWIVFHVLDDQHPGYHSHRSPAEHELTYLTQMFVSSSQVVGMSAVGLRPFEDLLSHLDPSHRRCGSQVDLVGLHPSCGSIEDDSEIRQPCRQGQKGTDLCNVALCTSVCGIWSVCSPTIPGLKCVARIACDSAWPCRKTT